ncbi:uncharacterized protein C1orf198 homolog isoform X1 [Lampetra fluviatilis]
MEEKAAVYFASLNPMARKIVAEIEKVRESHGPAWERLPEAQREAAIDAALIRAEARARYETRLHLLGARPASPSTSSSSSSPSALASCYPKLLIQPGQKTVHFGEDDIKWQDEHSAPFSWETKSQLEFSLSDLEPGSSSQPRPDSSLGHAGAATSAAATANGTATPAGGRAGKGQAGGREAHVVNTGPFPGVLRRVEEAGADETAVGPAAAPWKLSAERGKPAGAAAATTAGTGPGSGAALTPAERLSSPYRRHDSASRSYDPRAGPAASRSGDPPPVARKPPPPSPGASYSSMADTAHRAFVSEPDESVFAPLPSSSSPPSSSSFPPPAASAASAAVPWMLERAAASRPAPSVARTPPPVASAITVATPLLPASADKDELFTSLVGHSQQSPGTSGGVPIKSGFDFLDNW